MKSLLTLASIAAVSLATAAPAATQTSIVGTWLAVYDGGVVNTIAQWQDGGTTAQALDQSPAGGNLLLGTWRAKANGAVSASLRGWTFDNAGAVNGYFAKTEVERLQQNLRAYDGRFEVTFFDLNGNVTFQHSGTLTAHRLP